MTRRVVFWWAAIPAALVVLGQIVPSVLFGQGINFATASKGYLQASSGLRFRIFSQWGSRVANMGWPACQYRLVFSHGYAHLVSFLPTPPRIPGLVSISPTFHYTPLGDPVLGPVFYLHLVITLTAMVTLLAAWRYRLLPRSRALVCGVALLVSGAAANLVEVALLGGAIDWLALMVPIPGRYSAQSVLDVPDLAILAGLATLVIGTAWLWVAPKAADEQGANAQLPPHVTA